MYQHTMKPVLGSQIQLGHPLAQGLVGCWLMNEGGGNIVADLSGNDQTGTFTGDTGWTSGKFGPATVYDGTADTINITKYLWNFNSGFTFVTWVNITTPPQALYESDYIWHTYISDNDFCYTILRQSAAGVWMWRTDAKFNTTSKSAQGTASATFPGLAKWTQIVVRWDTQNLQVIIDNSLYATVDASGVSFSSNMGITTIGHALPPIGKIDHHLMYNRALSASEIAQLYREPFCMFDTPQIWSYYTIPTGGGQMTCNTRYWGT